jgi:hypothetical protein
MNELLILALWFGLGGFETFILESRSDADAARRCRAKSRPVFDRPGLHGVM